MHFTNSAYYLLAAAKTTSTTTKSTGSATSDLPLLAIIAIFALVYFAWMRPNQRKRMEAMRQRRAFDLGDEVVAGGMVGRVVRVGEGEVDVEVADGVVVQFVPQAVQSKAGYLAGAAGRQGAGRGFGGGMAGAGGGGNPGSNGASIAGSASSATTAGLGGLRSSGPGSLRSVRRREPGTGSAAGAGSGGEAQAFEDPSAARKDN